MHLTVNLKRKKKRKKQLVHKIAKPLWIIILSTLKNIIIGLSFKLFFLKLIFFWSDSKIMNLSFIPNENDHVQCSLMTRLSYFTTFVLHFITSVRNKNFLTISFSLQPLIPSKMWSPHFFQPILRSSLIQDQLCTHKQIIRIVKLGIKILKWTTHFWRKRNCSTFTTFTLKSILLRATFRWKHYC